VAEVLLGQFSFLAAWLQQRLLPREIRDLLNKDTRVRVGPGILKFHTNDRREQYSQEFQSRLNAVSSAIV